jgi:hypothetical protein
MLAKPSGQQCGKRLLVVLQLLQGLFKVRLKIGHGSKDTSIRINDKCSHHPSGEDAAVHINHHPQ